MHCIKREKGRCSRHHSGEGRKTPFLWRGKVDTGRVFGEALEDFRERFNSFGERILEMTFLY